MANKTILMLFFIFLITGCDNREAFLTYTIHSPDKGQFLTFGGEYDKDGILKNHQFYLMGTNVNGILDSVPDTNFVSFEFYGEMDFVLVKWNDDKIVVRSGLPYVNKLSPSSKIDYALELTSKESNECNATLDSLWFRYWFKKIHQHKYQ